MAILATGVLAPGVSFSPETLSLAGHQAIRCARRRAPTFTGPGAGYYVMECNARDIWTPVAVENRTQDRAGSGFRAAANTGART